MYCRYHTLSGAPPFALALAITLAGGLLPTELDVDDAGWRSMIGATLLPACRAQDDLDDDDGDERFVVIKAGKIITLTGKEIDGGVIVIANGKIRNVGRGIEYPLNSKIIDAREYTVMPGLINPATRAGLSGYRRTGVHGDLAAADEWRPRDGAFDELLDAGFTAVAIVPAGSDVPGRALVTRTGGPREERTLVSPGYVRVSADKKALREALAKAKAEIEKVEKAVKEHEEKLKKLEAERKQKEEQAKQQPKEEGDKQPKKEGDKPPASQPATKPAPASQPAFTPPEIDPAYQVLADLIQKKDGVRALIEFDGASDFVHLTEVLDEYEIAYDWLIRNSRQSDLDFVLEKLAESKPRVVLRPLRHRVPYSVERNPLVENIAKAGCEVSLIPLGDRAYEYAALLPRVADLVRDGWDREAALQALTLNPARLLGIDDRFGTIEKGKQADLIFLDADPLAPGARVRKVMIAGEIVHTVEYDKQ